jgi:hypothetical protein
MPSVQSVLWERAEAHSIEYFKLVTSPGKYVLEGTVVLPLEKFPTRITYKVECDPAWKTRMVDIQQERASEVKRLTLEVDHNQIWHSAGTAVPFARGFFDVDLEITPATNMLPIRRLALQEGQSAQVDAVWVRFPSLSIQRLQQRYTRIERNRYQYEGLSPGYQTQLEVDESGIVISYFGVWRQVSV